MGYGQILKSGTGLVRMTPAGAALTKVSGALKGLTSLFGSSHKQAKLKQVRRAIRLGKWKRLEKMSTKSKYGRVRGLATGALAYRSSGATGRALLSKAQEYRKGAWQAYRGENKNAAMPGGALLRGAPRRATVRRAPTRRRTTTTRRRTTTTRRYSKMPPGLRRYWAARRKRSRG